MLIVHTNPIDVILFRSQGFTCAQIQAVIVPQGNIGKQASQISEPIPGSPIGVPGAISVGLVKTGVVGPQLVIGS